MNKFFHLLALASVLFSGCASLPPVPPPGAAVQHCMVCRHQRDFACLRVNPGPETPQTTFDGRTYYFCSDGCRKDFKEAPAKYAASHH